MPRRKTILVAGEMYHIFNRGVEKRPTFESARDYQRYLLLMQFYKRHHSHQFSRLNHKERLEFIAKKSGDPIVEIVCYCLMPNHYHLILKQLTDTGISDFFSKIADGYTKYFNTIYERVGPLFQGPFKAVHIEDNQQLIHLSRYIHINPVMASLVKKTEDYPWSSYKEYLNQAKGPCQKEIVTKQFSSISQYEDFVNDYADYKKKLGKIEHLMIEK
ncbi:transposase [Candidatus Berkelbacteria bacterium]|nr:transposase [Candidatus Berkelbacteria bacterium]